MRKRYVLHWGVPHRASLSLLSLLPTMTLKEELPASPQGNFLSSDHVPDRTWVGTAAKARPPEHRIHTIILPRLTQASSDNRFLCVTGNTCLNHIYLKKTRNPGTNRFSKFLPSKAHLFSPIKHPGKSAEQIAPYKRPYQSILVNSSKQCFLGDEETAPWMPGAAQVHLQLLLPSPSSLKQAFLICFLICYSGNFSSPGELQFQGLIPFLNRCLYPLLPSFYFFQIFLPPKYSHRLITHPGLGFLYPSLNFLLPKANCSSKKLIPMPQQQQLFFFLVGNNFSPIHLAIYFLLQVNSHGTWHGYSLFLSTERLQILCSMCNFYFGSPTGAGFSCDAVKSPRSIHLIVPGNGDKAHTRFLVRMCGAQHRPHKPLYLPISFHDNL